MPGRPSLCAVCCAPVLLFFVSALQTADIHALQQLFLSDNKEDNEDAVREMLSAQKDMRIPLAPRLD